MAFFRDSKNLKLSEWETTLCFNYIFKFAGLFATLLLLSQVGLIQYKTMQEFLPREKSSGKHATHPTLVSPGGSGCPRMLHTRHDCLISRRLKIFTKGLGLSLFRVFEFLVFL